jgi:tungstate transport system ATP-binding protein
MANALLTLTHLGFEGRGHRVLDEVSLKLASRSTFILGPNGAGKSVLLRLMHGLLKPSSGEVRWEPIAATTPGSIAGRALRLPRIAMVFQRPVMLRRSVLDNVLYGLAVTGMREREEVRAREVLARVGLADLAARPARVLSGGEQQRVALARAWALRPDVLLLDEPTASLDPHGIRMVEAIIGEIAASGTTIIMTTHHRGVAKRLAADIVFLHQGRLAEHTPAEQFFAEPASTAGRSYLQGDLE